MLDLEKVTLRRGHDVRFLNVVTLPPIRNSRRGGTTLSTSRRRGDHPWPPQGLRFGYGTQPFPGVRALPSIARPSRGCAR